LERARGKFTENSSRGAAAAGEQSRRRRRAVDRREEEDEGVAGAVRAPRPPHDPPIRTGKNPSVFSFLSGDPSDRTDSCLGAFTLAPDKCRNGMKEGASALPFDRSMRRAVREGASSASGRSPVPSLAARLQAVPWRLSNGPINGRDAAITIACHRGSFPVLALARIHPESAVPRKRRAT